MGKNPKPVLQSGSNYLSFSLELKSKLVQAKLCAVEQNSKRAVAAAPRGTRGVPGSFSILCSLLMEFMKADSSAQGENPLAALSLLIHHSKGIHPRKPPVTPLCAVAEVQLQVSFNEHMPLEMDKAHFHLMVGMQVWSYCRCFISSSLCRIAVPRQDVAL